MGIFEIAAVNLLNSDIIFTNNKVKKAQVNNTLIFGSNEVPASSQTSLLSSLGCEFSAEKSVQPKQNKTYDENGNLIKEDFGAYTVEYEYDENGKKSKYIFEVGEGSEKIVKEYDLVAEYDENGNLTKRIEKNKDGEISSTQFFDNNGKITEIKYKGGGVVTFKYDDNGNLIQKEYTNKKGSSKYNFTYNNKNQLLQVKERSYYGSLSVTKYQYDDKGRVKNAKGYYNSDGLLCAVYITYDENGKIAQKKYAGFDGIPQRFLKYENGELTEEKIMYDNGAPMYIIKYENGKIVDKKEF